ncbi:MAG: hypothetical protein HY690_06205 [Chloroflexi bacterium]|nr:hypothetical protein [Chloroflexota bacterium]
MFGLLRLVVLLLVLGLVSGLAVRVLPVPPPGAPTIPTTVAALAAAPPDQYPGRAFGLAGRARHGLTSPMASFWLLEDDSGTLVVLSSFPAPAQGRLVQVRAAAYPLLVLGDWLRLGPFLLALDPPTTPSPQSGGYLP